MTVKLDTLVPWRYWEDHSYVGAIGVPINKEPDGELSFDHSWAISAMRLFPGFEDGARFYFSTSRAVGQVSDYPPIVVIPSRRLMVKTFNLEDFSDSIMPTPNHETEILLSPKFGMIQIVTGRWLIEVFDWLAQWVIRSETSLMIPTFGCRTKEERDVFVYMFHHILNKRLDNVPYKVHLIVQTSNRVMDDERPPRRLA